MKKKIHLNIRQNIVNMGGKLKKKYLKYLLELLD